jgi:N-acetyltransferase
MVFLRPELTGHHVRLEPLLSRHVAGLAQASAGAGDLYQMTKVPVGEVQAARFVALADAARASGSAAPFAVIRLEDGAVIGSTRLWDLQWWP